MRLGRKVREMTISRKELRALMVYPAKIGDKSRVYLPREIVDVLKVKPGDYIVFRVVDGKITVEKLK